MGYHDHIFWECPNRPADAPRKPPRPVEARLGWCADKKLTDDKTEKEKNGQTWLWMKKVVDLTWDHMYPQRKICREAPTGKNEDLPTDDFEINLSDDEEGDQRPNYDYEEDQLVEEDDDDEESARAPQAAVLVGEGGAGASRHSVPNDGR